MDFADVQKILGTATSLFKFYEENKQLLDVLLHRKLPPIVVATEPPPAPPVEDNGEPGQELPPPQPPPPTTKQIVDKLVCKLFFLEKSRDEVDKERAAGNPDPDKVVRKDVFSRVTSPQGPDAQMVDQRLHFDITPYDKNGEIGPHDVRHPRDEDGNPGMRYRWWRDGKLQTDSTDEEDHFELQSVIDDNGCTPVLQLSEPEPGRHQCFFEAYIPARYNGGVEVTSNRVTWFCD